MLFLLLPFPFLAGELRGLIGYKVSPPQLGWVLEPEIRELFVDEDVARASDAATTEELWRKIRETPSG